MNIEINNFTKTRVDIKYFQEIGQIVFKKLKQPENVEVSLVFVGDDRIKRLNKKYRGKNKTTDVLSFAYKDAKIPPSLPLQKGGKLPPPFSKEGWGGLLGEIVICLPQAKRQAKQHSYPLKHELTVLFIHGILHLAGYEDETEKRYSEMMGKQSGILGSLNFKIRSPKHEIRNNTE